MATTTPRRHPALRLATLAALVLVAFLPLLVLGHPQVRGQSPPLSDEEATLLALINDYRAQNGLSQLGVSPTLTATSVVTTRSFVPGPPSATCRPSPKTRPWTTMRLAMNQRECPRHTHDAFIALARRFARSFPSGSRTTRTPPPTYCGVGSDK